MKWRGQLTVEGKLKASHSYTTIFPDENMRDVWIGSGVAICVAVVLIVVLIMICKRRTGPLRSFVENRTLSDQWDDEYASNNRGGGQEKEEDNQSGRQLSEPTHHQEIRTRQLPSALSHSGPPLPRSPDAGVSGSELTVYSSAGELVSLPCNHHDSFNCSSTTWAGCNGRSPNAIELVTLGEDGGRKRLRPTLPHPPVGLDTGSGGVIGSEPTVYSSAGELVSHSSTTIFPGVIGSEPTVYSSAGELVSHSSTTIFPDKITRDVWIGSGVAICVAVVLIVILIMICRRRTVQRKMAYNHVSQSHTVTDQNKGESEDTVTYAVVNPSAGGKRKQDQESAVLETEYAIIKTSQNSNKP